jgi:hypothetical protein
MGGSRISDENARIYALLWSPDPMPPLVTLCAWLQPVTAARDLAKLGVRMPDPAVSTLRDRPRLPATAGSARDGIRGFLG